MCICYPFYRKSGRDSAFISRFPTALPCTGMNGFVPEVRTRDNWGVPLERFGFSREGDFWVASYETLKLPHDCGH